MVALENNVFRCSGQTCPRLMVLKLIICHIFLQKSGKWPGSVTFYKKRPTGSKYLRQAFQHIKKRVTYKVRKLRSEYYLKKIKENEGDLKGTWKILKQVMNKEIDQSNIQKLLYNGQEINDKQKISENFNDYFIGIGEELATGIQSFHTSSSDYLSKIEIDRNKNLNLGH